LVNFARETMVAAKGHRDVNDQPEQKEIQPDE
jgi:hypothetical protein